MVFKRQLEEAGITLSKQATAEYEVYYNDTYVGYLSRERHKGEGKWGSKTPAYYSWEVVRSSEPELYLTSDTFDLAKKALLDNVETLKGIAEWK